MTIDESTGSFDERADTALTPESRQPTRITVPAHIIEDGPLSSKTTKVVVPEQLLGGGVEGRVETLEEVNYDDRREPQEDLEISSVARQDDPKAEVAGQSTPSEDVADEDRTVIVHRPVPAPEVVGKSIEGYEIIGELGRGGAGIVYRAYCPKMRSLVALKVTHAMSGTKQEERFEREIRFLHRLEHPNLVNVYDSGRTGDGQRFLAMKYVDGTVLGKLFEISPPPGPWLAGMLSQVAEGLAAAHGQGIIHRDVSPQNIMVSYDGAVKLLDFGIAKAESHSTHTEAGVIKGKFAYMSPQQCTGEVIDSRSDIFALGICLFEALAGRNPFRRKSEFETMSRIVSEPNPVLRVHRADIPAELESVIQKAIAKLPEDRFQTAADFQFALESVLSRMNVVMHATRVGEVVSGLFRERIQQGPKLDTRLALPDTPASLSNSATDNSMPEVVSASVNSTEIDQLKMSQHESVVAFPGTASSRR